MGNQNSSGKFKPKGGSGLDLLSADQDPLHPANFPKTKPSRKGSDASSGGVARSEMIPSIQRRLSGLSPKNAVHRRNVSEGPPSMRPNSPTLGLQTDLSTLSTSSTWFKVSDSDSEASLIAPEITLETRDLSDQSEPSSATVRQSIKEKRDLAEASEIKPWLFLGGMEVAKSKEYLRSKGITHVLNCAHTVCDNYHENDFKYVRPIDLADASKEEIGNFMLQAIADIESVREDKGKILVHCQLGSSRSATLVIAYLMWLENLDAQTAFAEVKKKRSIVSPNLGFMVQLNAFKRRLDWRPKTPTLHRVAPHSATDGTLVVKLVVRADTKEPVVPRVEHLDPRGAFLLHSPQDRTMFLWVGPDVGIQAESDALARKLARENSSSALKRNDSPILRETYEQAGKRFGKIMCKYEKAFRDDNGNACQFVIVPTDHSAILALAEGADQNSCAARFWKTLGESVGTKTGIDSLRANRPTPGWNNETDETQQVAYLESSSSIQFAVMDITPSDRSLVSDISEDPAQSMSAEGIRSPKPQNS
jgi:protein-tyrosine phosphatase